ncbi:hypothetical protein [Photobacterium sanguinicancri]|uniref:DUF3301 domain-containing protein n=1 Tax=Photobacterium sanguinicancri TaxID=875932 RepID=A0AAW7YDM0_9GAMM|nr:hypothetical protein [Photobacterium sanguinicancri]KXI20958.1 hypothetical protein AS132_23805 [Photobacterium sanguinicancri]MDO6544720.1 hypothetical protein [Photobacterium sanguinicancri]
MDVLLISVIVLLMFFVFPYVSSRFNDAVNDSHRIIEVTGDHLCVRQFAAQRILKLRGKSLSVSDIIRIQYATQLPQGICVSLFNKSDAAVDFWVSELQLKAIQSTLRKACPLAIVERT